MAINERVITGTQEAAAAGNAGEEGLILHLDANDVDSYDGDGTEWVDITNHEYKPATNVSEHFNTVTYTGTGNTNAITGVGFQPDLIWIKNRDQTDSHAIVDSVRGITSPAPYIASNEANAEATSANMPTSVQSDGFTITGAGGRTNTNNEDYVAWCLKAGGAPTATNTATSGAMTANSVSIDGTLESAYTPSGSPDIYPEKMSINTKLGFSIVRYDGSNAQATFPHGLGVKPELVIFKRLNIAASWLVTDGKQMGYLDGTDSLTTTRHNQYIASMDANTIEVKDVAGINDSGDEIIAYCFASKRGVSKVGSYTGTGSAGNKVYTGFEPAFVMIKNTSDTGNWIMIDNKRATSDPRTPHLRANSSAQDDTGTGEYVDFNRDDFTVDGTGQNVNHSGDTYIYLAFAKDTNFDDLIDDTDLEIHLDPANTSSYSGTGTTYSDLANSNDFTLSEANMYDQELGNYFNFVLDDEITSSASTLSLTAPISIECWVNLDDVSDNGAIVTKYESGTDNRVFAWYIASGTLYVASYYESGGGGNTISLTADNVMEDGKWHHLVHVIDGTAAPKFYIDGELAGTGSSSNTNLMDYSAVPIVFGQFYNRTDDDYDLHGKIGQFRLYNTSLSQDQIRQNFNFTKNDYPNGFDGTINGATFLPSGVSFDFDGNNDYIKIPSTIHSPVDFSKKNYTISMWVNLDSAPSFNAPLVSKYGTSDSLRSIIFSINSSRQLQFSQRTSSTDAQVSSSTISTGTWTHVAVVRDLDTVKFYIDGDLDVSRSTTFTPNAGGTQAINIGSQANGNYNFFNGKISDVKLFDRVLTSDEISAQEAIGYNGIG